MTFKYAGYELDSVELKCMVVSHGLTIDKAVYQRFGSEFRLNPNALTCNCFKLPDGTIVMATDMGFHLSTLSSMFSWDNLKLFKYMADLKTDYRVRHTGGGLLLIEIRIGHEGYLAYLLVFIAEHGLVVYEPDAVVGFQVGHVFEKLQIIP